jgi:hypothetical protein
VFVGCEPDALAAFELGHVRAIAMHGTGIFTLGSHEAFEPEARVEHVVVRRDERAGEQILRLEIGKVLLVRPEIFARAELETAPSEPPQGRRRIRERAIVVEPELQA